MLKNSPIRNSSNRLLFNLHLDYLLHSEQRYELRLSRVNLNHRREIVARRQTLSYRCCFVKNLTGKTRGGRSDKVTVRHIFRVALKRFHVTLSPWTPWSCLSLALWCVNYWQTRTNETGDIIYSTKQSLPHTHLGFQEENWSCQAKRIRITSEEIEDKPPSRNVCFSITAYFGVF